MLKQIFKVVMVAGLLLTVASPALAGSINLMLDPITGGGNDPYYILPGAGSSPITWQSCTAMPSGPLPPAGPGSEFIGDAACLVITNYTGGSIFDLKLTFMIPTGSPLIGDTLTCSNEDSYLTANCGTITIEAGTMSLTFSGGTPVPALDTIVFGETSTDGNLLPNGSVSVPTYDPSTLILLLAGMSMLAVAGTRRTA